MILYCPKCKKEKYGLSLLFSVCYDCNELLTDTEETLPSINRSKLIKENADNKA